MKKCSKCYNEIDHAATSSWCKVCKRDQERNRRLTKGIKPKRLRDHIDEKLHKKRKRQCFACFEILPLREFSEARHGWRGLKSYCRGCETLFHRQLQRENKLRYKTYRDKYRKGQKYKVNHRNHQAKRRAKIKAGNVSNEFLTALYNESCCYYCGDFVPKKSRTMDHRTPLSRNGKHEESNLVMACEACNFRKGDKTEREFK